MLKPLFLTNLLLKNGQKKFYLKNEVFNFLNLLETISRLREVRVFLLANSVTISNPYFLYFDLAIPSHSDIALFKNNTILVQYMKNKSYQETKKNTRFRFYGRTVLLTQITLLIIISFLIMIALFRKKLLLLNLLLLSFLKICLFGVWFDYANNLCFVSSKFPHNTPYIFSMSLADHTENTLLIKNYSKYAGLRHFIDFYKKRSSSFRKSKYKKYF